MAQISRFLEVVALSTALFAGCGGNSDSKAAACRSVCEDTCKALTQCNVADLPPTCVDDCAAGLGSSTNCAYTRPADQLTCAELKNAYDIAVYCATACQRAPECGTFDENLCATGCATSAPPIHNPKSVAARTCDQLKPEVRDYEDLGRAQQGGEHSVTIRGGTTNPYGLCETASDCDDTIGCDLDTNTCTACKTNADCALGYGTYLCTPDKGCLSVNCLTDADCSLASSSRCDPAKHSCVECIVDADCAGAILGPKCDPTEQRCVGCLSNADCSGGYTCSLAAHFCSP